MTKMNIISKSITICCKTQEFYELKYYSVKDTYSDDGIVIAEFNIINRQQLNNIIKKLGDDLSAIVSLWVACDERIAIKLKDYYNKELTNDCEIETHDGYKNSYVVVYNDYGRLTLDDMCKILNI